VTVCVCAWMPHCVIMSKRHKLVSHKLYTVGSVEGRALLSAFLTFSRYLKDEEQEEEFA